MFSYRRDPDDLLGVGVAFTDDELDLGDRQRPEARAASYDLLSDALGVGVAVASQVHGVDVLWASAPAGRRGLVDLTGHRADALATTQRGLGVAVRVADCVPVCLASRDGRAVAAVHAGRAGLLGGVLPRAIAALGGVTDAPLLAWVGPHIGACCYEVPDAMAADAADRLGTPCTRTTWGTASIDLGAGVLAQLDAAGVAVEVVDDCTLHGTGLHSHRRGPDAGRQVGVVWIAAG